VGRHDKTDDTDGIVGGFSVEQDKSGRGMGGAPDGVAWVDGGR
jgi:hypothetical protein